MPSTALPPAASAAATTARPRLPHGASVSPSQATLSQRIGRGCHTPVPALAPDATLSLHPADAATIDWSATLRLSGAFGVIHVAQGARLLRALSGIDLGEQDAGASADWLRAAVCGRLAGTPFGAVDALAPGGAHDDDAHITLRLTLRSASHCVATHARAAASDWLDLLDASDWRLEQRQPRHFDDVALALPVRLARHRLPAHLLPTLKAGDVILPAGAAFACDGGGVVEWGPLRAQVRFQAPGTLTILALENRMDAAHWESATDYADAPLEGPPGDTAAPHRPDDTALAPGALDDVGVTLDFELGHVATSFGALRALGVGSTLLLAQSNPVSIAIVCGKRLLGRGEAVDVDGQLGVRIIEWGPA
jgi:type III secretion protein Q